MDAARTPRMVSTYDEDDHTRTFVIRPNRSMSWTQHKRFFALMLVVVLGVALGFTLLGFWPVLPFAGLELTVLALGLWLSARSGLDTEVVKVREHQVAVLKGRRRLEPVWSAERCWAQIKLQTPRAGWYPARLVMRSRGQEVQLASFLCEEEKKRLAEALRRAIEHTPA